MFEVLPAQTNGFEREKRFVNVHVDCIVSNRKRIKISTFPPPGKLSASAHGYIDVDLILASQSVVVVLLGSIPLCHSKTINAKVVSFLNLHTERSNQKALQFLRVVSS